MKKSHQENVLGEENKKNLQAGMMLQILKIVNLFGVETFRKS